LAELGRELVQEGALAGQELVAGLVEREPGGAVDFRELLPVSGPGRPLDPAHVAADGARVEIALDGPGADELSGLLLEGREFEEVAGRFEAGLLLELAARGVDGRFTVVVAALGDGPGAGVLVLPVRAAGVDEQDLEGARGAAT